MPTEKYTRNEFEHDMQTFKARKNPTRDFEKMGQSVYQETRSNCKLHLEIRKKLTVIRLMFTAITVKRNSKQWDATTTSFPVKKHVPF